MKRLLPFLITLSTCLSWGVAFAQSQPAPACASASDRTCLALMVMQNAEAVAEPAWRDKAYRELAVSLTYDGRVDDAIALVPRITNPDTQAMTIRGIGMAAALYKDYTPERLRAVFAALKKAAGTINHPVSPAVAMTYVAMSEAFAKLDDDAWATAASIENLALRQKAFGETAEIQAERGDITKAMASAARIDTGSFRNKAYESIAEIMIKTEQFDAALQAAKAIDNPQKRAQIVQDIMSAQDRKARGTRRDIPAIKGAE